MRIGILILCLTGTMVFGQKPKVSFLSDSVMVGTEIKLSMAYLHNSKSDIVFPDSSFDFSPFKYVSTDYFETKTVDGKSLDSVIYTLVTYQLDPVLSIRPYIKNLNSGERTYSDTASVFLMSLLHNQNIQSADFKQTVNLFKVKKDINILKYAYIIFGILLIAFFLIAFFGDWIVRKYLVWKSSKRHQQFVSEFKRKSLNPRDGKNIQGALTSWKGYLEELVNVPVSTMSTSEIGEVFEDERLKSALKMFDIAIFGGVINDQIPFAYHILLEFASRKFKQEKKRIMSVAQ